MAINRTSIFGFSSLFWVFFGIGFLWFIYIAYASPDAFFQDEIGHFLLSKQAWSQPELILQRWGRPMMTLLYMPPALFGFDVGRFLSIVIAVVTVLLTAKIAQYMKLRHISVLPLLLWFQPWFLEFSYSTNTMVPFSLFLTGGVYFWTRDKLILASICFGLLPLLRHEGVALTGIWFGYLFLNQHWRVLVYPFIPLALYNSAYLLVFGELASGNYFDTKPTTFYGSGGWFHYLPGMIRGIFPLIGILAFWGIAPILKSRFRIFFLPYLFYLLVHVVIYRFGFFASGGYYFFLVPLAPAVALASLWGIDWLISHRKPVFLFATAILGVLSLVAVDVLTIHAIQPYYIVFGFAVAFIFVFMVKKKFVDDMQYNAFKMAMMGVIVSVVTTFGLMARINPYGDEASSLRDAAQFVKDQNPSRQYPVYSTNVWFYMFYDLPYRGSSNILPDLDDVPKGGIIVWDDHYSDRTKINYVALSSNPEWEALSTFGDSKAIVFRKVGER